jgi:hypothetical protein
MHFRIFQNACDCCLYHIMLIIFSYCAACVLPELRVKVEPRTLIEQLEITAALPEGSNERFSGYGVMGLPFESGHVLALRRFPVSSIGSSYTSVWHRSPESEWVFYSNVSPSQSCPRFFGAIAADAIETEIRLTWTGTSCLRIVMPLVPFEWELEIATTPATAVVNALARALPKSAWLNPAILTAMGLFSGPLLGVGRVGLHGLVPNGQHFIANPRMLWATINSKARLREADFGPPGPLHQQARLGDFWIPQRGMFAVGLSYFDSLDPALHSTKTHRT